jgi:hypothetical protein
MGSCFRRFRAAGLMVGLVTPLVGCTTEEPPPPIVVTTPVPPTRSIYAQTSVQGFATDYFVQIPFDLTVQGRLDITVNWTFPDTWIYVYFGDTACSYAEVRTHTCPFLIVSEKKDPKPRVLYTNLLDPKTYYLILYNVPRDPRTGIGSDNTENVSIQVGITPSSPAGVGEGTPVHLGRPTVVMPPGL